MRSSTISVKGNSSFRQMRTLCILMAIYAIVLLPGCNKKEPEHISCNYQRTAGMITGIAGPDSARVNEQQAFTVDVSAPGLCIAGIEVTAIPQNDTLYYLEAMVEYNADSSIACGCEVAEHHYKRIFLTAPATGNIAISTSQGIGPSPTHTIKVY